MLELRNIYAGYVTNNHILKGLNLIIKENEVIGIIGQNGSGKSTLAKTIMNLVPHITGEIIFDGKPIFGKCPNEIAVNGIGFFIQGGRVFPNLTVEENLVFASRGLKKDEANKRIEELESIFELLKTRRKKITASYLSGGEQHQLALAMILINKPRMLVLDEPSAGLSPINVKSFFKTLDSFREKSHTTVLLIEQNISIAFENSDKIKLLENGVFSMEENASNDFEKRIINHFFNSKGKEFNE
ncbi:MAG: ATP-binding cassette domain-containing protein [Ignavibacteriaceae bacterium]|nr:ATP-binding cassette domain-containing protein [Ignavibacteriaceae bacterium]